MVFPLVYMHSFLNKKGKKLSHFVIKAIFVVISFGRKIVKSSFMSRCKIYEDSSSHFPRDIFKKSDLLNATDTAQCGSSTYILHSKIEFRF